MIEKEQKEKAYESQKVYAYLNQIAETPLLTEYEEKEIFSCFQKAKEDIEAILKQFPKEIIDKVKDMQGSDGRGPKRKDERWWNSLSILEITDQIKQEIGNNHKRKFKQLTLAVEHLMEIRNRIVSANLLLVADTAEKHCSFESSLSFGDLMQEGSIGLMRAVDRFDPKKGHRFSTYAYWCKILTD